MFITETRVDAAVGSTNDDMQQPKDNLLVRLHNYASHQDENFTTEAFVHLLRHLQTSRTDIFISLLTWLSGDRLRLTSEECSELRITTQSAFTEGTPDILLSSPTYFVLIEVKVGSGLGWNQLDRYRKLLESRNEPRRCLILLTCYPMDADESGKADFHARWYRVAGFLEKALRDSQEHVTLYVIQQFLEFLTKRGMTMEQVSWELTRGVHSLLNLMDMVAEAVTAANVRQKPLSAGAEYMGRYFYPNETECWSGVYYAEPNVLLFEAHGVPKTKACEIGFGTVQQQNKETCKWTTTLDLQAELVHFFALSPESQQKRIEEFIGNCVSAVKTMSTPAVAVTGS